MGFGACQLQQTANSEAAQHHLKELLEDTGTSKYSVSDDDNAAHAHCIESDSDQSVVEVRQHRWRQ